MSKRGRTPKAPSWTEVNKILREMESPVEEKKPKVPKSLYGQFKREMESYTLDEDEIRERYERRLMLRGYRRELAQKKVEIMFQKYRQEGNLW